MTLQAAINDDLMQDEMSYLEELNSSQGAGGALDDYAGGHPAMSMNMDAFMNLLDSP